MPPRPFPFQLSVGTDICRVSRIADVIRSARVGPGEGVLNRQIQRLLNRMLSAREQRIFWARYEARISSETDSERNFNAVTKHLAGRWAAKEAAIKAVTWRKVTFHHIQILPMSMQSADAEAPEQPVTSRVFAFILDAPASVKRSQSTFSNVRRPLFNSKSTTDSDSEQRLQAGAEPKATSVVFDQAVEVSTFPSDTFTPESEQTNELPGQIGKISISHDGDYAVAVCMVAEEPAVGDVGGEAAARGM